MSDFKTRLKDEAKELVVKIRKLESYLDSERIHGIDEFQASLLWIQRSAMKTYLSVLNTRIERL